MISPEENGTSHPETESLFPSVQSHLRSRARSIPTSACLFVRLHLWTKPIILTAGSKRISPSGAHLRLLRPLGRSRLRAETVSEGLPALRREWTLCPVVMWRNMKAATISPEDNGYLSQEHARKFNENKEARNRLKVVSWPEDANRSVPPTTPSPSSGMHGRAFVTPEMEFIAIRENLGREAAFRRADATAIPMPPML